MGVRGAHPPTGREVHAFGAEEVGTPGGETARRRTGLTAAGGRGWRIRRSTAISEGKFKIKVKQLKSLGSFTSENKLLIRLSKL